MAPSRTGGSGEKPMRRSGDIDARIGARMRARRITLGLTQQEMAERIGVTYQQAHKYEKGINRIAAGRLFTIAQALGVSVDFFFDDAPHGSAAGEAGTRLMLELARNFRAIDDPALAQALAQLVRILAHAEGPALRLVERHNGQE